MMFSLIVVSDAVVHLRLLTIVVYSILFLRLEADESPTVIYAIINQTARLPCPLPRLATPRVEWFDLVYNTDPKPKKIFSASGKRRVMEVNHPNGVNYDVDANFTLFIRNVKLEDAGAYNCTSRLENFTLIKKYYLAVSGFPLCNGQNPIIAGQTGHYSCESTFSGNYQPHLEWKRGESDNTLPSVDNFDVRLAKKVFILNASADDDETAITCSIRFGNIVEKCSITLTVLYPVRDLIIDPIKDSFAVDEEIRCSASGNPTPEISFEPTLSASRTGFGWRSVTIPKSLGGQKATVVCTASNSVDGREKTLRKSISFTVENHDQVGVTEENGKGNPAQSKSASSSGAIVGGIVVGIMILVIIVAVVFCIRLRKDKKPAKEENGGAKTPPTTRDETQTQLKENQV